MTSVSNEIKEAGRLLEEASVLSDSGDVQSEVSIYERLINKFQRSGSAEVIACVGTAELYKGLALARLGELESALAQLQSVFEAFCANPDPKLRANAARAKRTQGDILQDLGIAPLDAADAYNETISMFRAAEEPEICMEVATALVDCGETYLLAGEVPAGKALLDEALGRLASVKRIPTRELRSRGLLLRADALARLGYVDEALAHYSELIDSIRSQPDDIRIILAASANKGMTLYDLGRVQGSLEVLDVGLELARNAGLDDNDEFVATLLHNREVALSQFSSSPKAQGGHIRDRAATEAHALLEAGAELEEAGQLAKAASVFADVNRRYAHEERLNLEVAVALAARSQVLARMFEFRTSIEAATEVLDRFGSSRSADMKLPIARARLCRASSYYELGKRDQALVDCHELLKLGSTADEELRLLVRLGGELREQIISN